jgi:hypothetical protein
MEIIWKDIIGYEGHYKINNKGCILSINRLCNRRRKNVNEKILKTPISSRGYFKVILCKDGIEKNFNIHRLIAVHFIDNPNNKPCINHIDGNKLNNTINNLEWCTIQENTQHAYNCGLQLPTININRVFLDNEIIELRKIILCGLFTQQKIATVYNTTQSVISRIKHNKIYKCR